MGYHVFLYIDFVVVVVCLFWGNRFHQYVLMGNIASVACLGGVLHLEIVRALYMEYNILWINCLNLLIPIHAQIK